MYVLPLEYLSVHAPISFSMRCKLDLQGTIGQMLLPLPPKLKWDSEKAKMFVNILEIPNNLFRIENLRIKLSNEGGDFNRIDAIRSKYKWTYDKKHFKTPSPNQ